MNYVGQSLEISSLKLFTTVKAVKQLISQTVGNRALFRANAPTDLTCPLRPSASHSHCTLLHTHTAVSDQITTTAPHWRALYRQVEALNFSSGKLIYKLCNIRLSNTLKIPALADRYLMFLE